MDYIIRNLKSPQMWRTMFGIYEDNTSENLYVYLSFPKISGKNG